MLLTNNLGYPRVGAFRELKKANEAYWAKKSSVEELLDTAKKIREGNWKTQKDAGIDLIPSNDFSFYDQVLDLTLTVGAIPARYHSLLNKVDNNYSLDLYFAMARGFQQEVVGYELPLHGTRIHQRSRIQIDFRKILK